jgi:Uma2 family endonuclease
MSVAVRSHMTLEDFLDWESQQDTRYEFDGFQPVAMVGGTTNHSRVQRNLITALTVRLRGKPCEAFGSDLKIIAAGSVRYPDAFVVCSPVIGRATAVEDAVVVFEILSPSTSAVDRIIKNREYRDTPSIQRYVILEQDRLAATVFDKAGGAWVGHLFVGETDLPLPEIDLSIPLAELYEQVELAPEEPTEDLPRGRRDA